MTDLDELETALHAAIVVGDKEQADEIGRRIDTIPAPTVATVLSAALWYAQAGLHVFPLSAGTKIPHKGTRGCKEATGDEATIRAWWERWPDSSVGIATGHLVDVVDIDGATGQQSRAHNWEMFSSLNIIGTVLTPRPGGMHLYVPANPAVGNGAGLLPAIDYRGRGGYVVAPPSTTEQGSYRWLRALNLDGITA